MNSFYGYSGVCSSPVYASPTVCNSPSTYASPNSPPTYASPTSPPTYNSYQMTPSVSNSCSFYPTENTSSAVCPAQCPMYSTSMSSSPSCSYQTTTPILSTTSCQLAQSFIHSGFPGEGASHLIDSICPPDMMQDGECHVDNAVLFAVLDRI